MLYYFPAITGNMKKNDTSITEKDQRKERHQKSLQRRSVKMVCFPISGEEMHPTPEKCAHVKTQQFPAGNSKENLDKLF